jgi:hypothetical protein
MRLLHGYVHTFVASCPASLKHDAQRFCQSQAGAEMVEILGGLKRRCEILAVDFPEEAIVDNCCHVVGSIKKVFPDIKISLDVHHFMQR